MIHTQGLTKHFKTVEAVRGIDIDVSDGELVALLGPNGAGKSTTLRMLTTLLEPTSGTATVAGFSVTDQRDDVRRHIGYVGQGSGAGNNQRVRDELITQGRCYSLSAQASRQRADELVDALDLGEFAGRSVSTLSGGQRRRLDIALGLVHRPPLLFLDEPTTGMDPQSRANLWEHILRLRTETGTTIVLTTHYLEEADSMAERVIVVDRGVVIADDTAASLKNDLASDLVVVATADRAAAQRIATTAERIDQVCDVTVAGSRVQIRSRAGSAVIAELLRNDTGAGVLGVDLSRPTLDDVFLGLTGRSLRESHSAPETASVA
ncbi:ABC transporter ATP-binding protein [Antrihabitans cavernicola]|uniref:ABC transporter ATP-binding protein n=2 Tax=Antrihabitans cavernicola TaxID=2495913 RepID=A0A5A7SJ97_9NOCA|nr:ABC transporter ATP-binding protein [Spelaeibacter cavernicola]